MERIFVTGGAGFIGSHLTEKLLGLDCRLTVYDDLSAGRKDFLPLNESRLKFIEGSITDDNRLRKSILDFDPDVVIHLSAIHFIPYCDSHPARTLEVNVGGTRNLLERCREVGVDTLLVASSAALYPKTSKPLREDMPLKPTGVYGFTKVIKEDLARLFYHDEGARTIIVRPFNVYGPRETNPHVIPEIIEQLKSGRRVLELGNISPKRDFVHVKDVVDAIVALLERFEGGFGIFNIGTGEEFSVEEIVELCGQVIGEEIKIKQSEDRKRESDRNHLLADIRRIEEEVGWSPVIELKDGIRDLLS